MPDELRVGNQAEARHDAVPALRFTVDGRVYEVPPTCPHRGGPLRDATQSGPFLRCAWHGATFDIRTGRLVRGPQCPDLVSTDVTPDRGAGFDLADRLAQARS